MFRLTKSANNKIRNITSVMLVFVLLLGSVSPLGASPSTAYANSSTIELEPVGNNSELSGENLRTQELVPLLVPISDQTFTPLNEGYAPDTQETKTITLRSAGPEMVEDIQVTVEGGLETADPLSNTTNSNDFIVVQPKDLVLFDEGQETTFTVKADNNLTPGTYVGTVTITALRMTPVTFKVTQVIEATPNYSIQKLEDRVFPPLVKDYPAGTPDYREITISSEVMEELSNLQVSVSGGLEMSGQALHTQDSSSFEVTQPQPSVLTSYGKQAKFLVRAKDNLPVGTHIGTVTVTADTMTPVTFKVTQVVKAPEYYSITPISKQEMTPVAVGYGSGTQETRTITITKAGEGDLENLRVWTSFGTTGFFVFSQPVLTTLTDEHPTTTFTVTAKNELARGHYAESLHIEADRMKDTTFIVSQLVDKASNPLTYSIAPIGNPVFRDLDEGYASGTQDVETITLTNTGTGILNNLHVDVSDDEEVPEIAYRGERMTSFEVSQPEINPLAVNGLTTFTVKAKDSLDPGTYNGTVTVWADNLTPVTFKVTQVVQEKKLILPIGAQTLEPLFQGYADGSPQVVTLTITKAGDEDVEGLGVTTPSYSTASDFPATQPLAVNLTAEHPSTTFTIRFTDRMPAGTYTGTYKIVDKNNKVLDTFTVTQVVQERLPYSIGPISEQVFRELEEGYADDTQETKAITIINTGTKALEGIQVYVRDGFGGPTAEARSTGISHFEINDADMTTTLGATGNSTSFKVKAKDGLEPGTYVGTVTIEADDLTPVMFKVTQVVHAAEVENPGYIEEISDKTMPEVEEGYSEDFSSETWIPIRRAGTEHPSIYNLRVEITDPNHAFIAPFLTVNGLNEQYQQADLRIKSAVGLLAGTYVGKVKIYSGDLLLDTFTVTLVVNARDTNTYSISSIGDQTLRVLEEDYASNSQETKAITVTNAGTGTLKELRVSVRDQSGIESRAKDNGSFEVTTPLQETLDTGASTTFTLKARDGLPAGTYVGKVTVKADRMESVTFLVTQVVQEAGETPLTYSITPISDQTLNALSSGYASGSQEARSIAITRTGTADLQNVRVQLYDRMEARATVSESVYFEVTQPVVQTLTSETPSTTFTVKAKDSLAPGTYTTTVRVSAAEMVPVYFKVTQVVNKPSIPDSSPVYYSSSPADPGVDVLVNGKKESAGKMVNTTVDNRTVTTFTLDEQKLTQKLTAEGKQAVVTLPIQSQADVIIGELNGRMVKTMAAQQAVLEIKTDTATYTLPAQQINIDALSAAIGQDVALADITIQVTIAKAQASTVQLLEKAGQQGGFTPVASLVSFTITANYKDKTVSVDKFNTYVARTIALPTGIDSNKITTGIVIDPDGTVRHVPTEVTLVNGIYYAKLNSLTNSDYAVVWHPLAFSDVSGHWAQAAINDMGSRMVVSGNGQGLFNPNANITRAEFASIVVQGLGLKPAYEPGNFSDIAANAWYSGAVSTAHAYGLIAGYPDGSFRPNEQITREQAMTIIAKAMKLTGLKDKLTQQNPAAALTAYTDSSKVAGWAAAGVADCVLAEIIKGRSGATLAPKANLTRAELAVIVRLLLQNSDLI